MKNHPRSLLSFSGPGRTRPVFCTLAALAATAAQAFAGASISYNFSENPGNQVLDTTTPKGPLGSTFWNDSNAEGAPGALGTPFVTPGESNLVDNTGTATTAAISWTSANTWWNGTTLDSDNARIVVGYLDDGGTGPVVTVENIPYAKYNVYGILGSDVGTEYQTQNFLVNGNRWAFESPAPRLLNSGSLGAAGNTTQMGGTILGSGALAGAVDPAFSTTQPTAQIVKVPYNAALNPGGDFTIEAWLKPSQTLSGGSLTCALSSMEVSGNRTGWLIYQSATGWNFRTYNANGPNTAVNITGGPVPTAGVWNHVVATWDSTLGVGKLYVDGVLVATSGATTYTPCTTRDMHFGTRSDGAFAWGGEIDEVAFYGDDLNATTVGAHRTNGLDPMRATPYETLIGASSPIGYWRGTNDTIQTKSAGGALAYGTWQGAGSTWIRAIPAPTNQRGNYFRVTGLTGSTCTIAGEDSSAPGRGSLAGIIIEEVTTQTQFVDAGTESFENADLGASLTSRFRVGLDSVTITDTFAANTPHSVEIVPVPGAASGTYVLMDYTGSIGGDGFAGLSVVPPTNPRYSWSLVDNTANSSVDLNYGAATDSITWTDGAATGQWNTSDTNWKTTSGNLPTNFFAGDLVVFDDSASAGAVDIPTEVQPLSVSVANSSVAYTLNGTGGIGGTASLAKSGAGILTINTNNTFTGATNISGGTVVISGAGNLGAGGASLSISGGATLQGAATHTMGRRMTIPDNATVQVDTGVTLGTTAGFNGGGVLSKTGDGELRFNSYSSNGFSGSIIVEDGTLTMAGGAFNGNIGLTSITVKGGATLNQPPGAFHALGGYFANVPTIHLEEGSTFTLDQENYFQVVNLTGATISGSNQMRTDAGFQINSLASATTSVIGTEISGVNTPFSFNVADGGAAIDLQVTGPIVNSQPLVKSGPGTLELTGTSTYTGSTTVQAGTLKLAATASLSGTTLFDVQEGATLDVTAIAPPGFFLSALLTLKGNGTVAGDLNWEGTILPGASAGELDIAGHLTVGQNSKLGFEIADWNGAAGTGYDVIDAVTVDIQANPFGPLTITITPDSIANFTEATKTFKLVRTTGGITNFDEASIAIDATAFTTATGATGAWSVRVTGNDLELVYTSTAPAGYATWAGGFGVGDADEDADNDGLANGIEFVLGTNPTATTGGDVLPTLSLVNADVGNGPTDYMLFTFRRSDLSAADNPYAEYDTNLAGPWTEIDGSDPTIVTQVDNDHYAAAPDGIDRVRVYIPRTKSVDGKLFGRLGIMIP